MERLPIRPLVSEEAQRWIDGSFDPVAYFALAREVAEERAHAEVVRRLRNHRASVSWFRFELTRVRPARLR